MTTADPLQQPTPRRDRIIALDAARGLAVIGMFIQHFASTDFSATIVSGNTTLLFVLCGGISYSIMSGRVLSGRASAPAFRTRMLGRAVFIDSVGYLLILLNAPAGVILPAYAGLFVLALTIVRRSTRTLATVTAILLIVAPPLMLLGSTYLANAPLLADLAGGPLSALALAPAFVLGMLLGRLDLHQLRTAVTITAAGAFATITGAVAGVSILPKLASATETWQATTFPAAGTPDQYATWPNNATQPNFGQLFATAPHTASTFQTLTGLGVACLALGIIALIARLVPVVLIPFAAAGRVALTLYALQFVVMWAFGLAGADYQLIDVPFAELLIAVVTICIALALALFPRGPLEALMRHVDKLLQPERSATTMPERFEQSVGPVAQP